MRLACLAFLVIGLASVGSAQSVDFRGIPRIGSAPLDVQFMLRYGGSATPIWDFGDGTSASGTNPLHTYTSAGTYAVTVTIPDAAGDIVVNKPDYVSVSEGGGGGDAVELSAAPETGIAPLSVQFSSVLPSGVTRVEWDFGDGTVSSETDPTHVYTAPGTYSVSMRHQSGPGGVIETAPLANPIVVMPLPPAGFAVDFSATPTFGPAPLQVSFTPSASAPLVTTSWGFGDGGSSMSTMPTHTYTQPGTYSVMLTAASATGMDTEVKMNHIVVTQPGTATTSNVLLILADDLGTELLGFYAEFGATDFPTTPVLETLAQDGLLFENTWSTPYCSPTRATIMTGRYGFRTGIGQQIAISPGTPIGVPDSEIMIPGCLPGNYASSTIGKWHMGESLIVNPCDALGFGFDLYDGIPFVTFDYFMWDRSIGDSNGCTTLTDFRYLTTGNVDSALDWIQDQNGPWFCYLPLQEPFNLDHAPPPSLQYQRPAVTSCGNRRNCAKASVEAMDIEIGRLLAGLGPDWQDDTTVIFLGDNGTFDKYMLEPYDQNRSKGTVYERGVNVPFIITGAGVAQANRGMRTGALAHTVDVMATICSLTGGSMPADRTMDSVDLTPVLQGPTGTAVRDWVFTEHFQNFDATTGCTPGRRSTAIRNDRFKLVRLPSGNQLLFDLMDDPLEEVPIPLPPTWEPALSSFAELGALLDGPLKSDC